MKGLRGIYARLSVAFALAFMLCVSAFASGEGSSSVNASDAISGITTQMTTGLSEVVPAILTGLGALAAAGLVIFGAKFAVNQGLAMFRKVTGRG